jgi:hypothetical protein
VLLVKLRKAEARSNSLAEEVAVLRAAVDSQSGTWFDDIHATVERVTREGMQRADNLQVRPSSVLLPPSTGPVPYCVCWEEGNSAWKSWTPATLWGATFGHDRADFTLLQCRCKSSHSRQVMRTV